MEGMNEMWLEQNEQGRRELQMSSSLKQMSKPQKSHGVTCRPCKTLHPWEEFSPLLWVRWKASIGYQQSNGMIWLSLSKDHARYCAENRVHGRSRETVKSFVQARDDYDLGFAKAMEQKGNHLTIFWSKVKGLSNMLDGNMRDR